MSSQPLMQRIRDLALFRPRKQSSETIKNNRIGDSPTNKSRSGLLSSWCDELLARDMSIRGALGMARHSVCCRGDLAGVPHGTSAMPSRHLLLVSASGLSSKSSLRSSDEASGGSFLGCSCLSMSRQPHSSRLKPSYMVITTHRVNRRIGKGNVKFIQLIKTGKFRTKPKGPKPVAR